MYRPTEAEFDVLQLLWEMGPSTVRAVNDRLNEQTPDREIGYTTTLKIMQIMAEKGLVDRNTDQRVHVYRAAVREAEVQSDLLQRFVDTTFRGSAAKLVMRALGQHRASAEELAEIKRLIERMENDSPRNNTRNS